MKKFKTNYFKNFGVLSIAVLMIIFFALTSNVFLSIKNIGIIAQGRVVVGFFGMAAMLPLIVGEFDISLGNMIGFIIMFGAMVARAGASPLVIVLSMLGIALVSGIVNAVICVVLKVPSTVSTMGLGMVFYGLSLSINNCNAITGVVPHEIKTLVTTKILNFNASVWILLIFAFILYYILEHTPLGKQMYAVGLSERVSYLAAIRTKFIRFLSFVIASFLIGISAVILLGQSGNAYPSTGPDYLLPGLAVVFFSITTHITGRFNVPGLIASLLMLGIMFNGVSLLGAPFWTESLVNGLILITIVLTTNIISKRRALNS